MDKLSISEARKALKALGYKLSVRSVPMCGDVFKDVNLLFNGKELGTIFTSEGYEQHRLALEIFNRIDKKK